MTNADGVEIPTATEAREIAVRFINSHFNNPDRERPRISIPADRKRDDDLRLIAFIKGAGEIAEVLRAAGEAEDADDATFDAASDALWAMARKVAGKPPREGVSEKTSPIKDTVKDAKGHAAEVSDSEDERGYVPPAECCCIHGNDMAVATCAVVACPVHGVDDEPSTGDEVRRGS